MKVLLTTFLTLLILNLVQSITVPPVWPKQTNSNRYRSHQIDDDPVHFAPSNFANPSYYVANTPAPPVRTNNHNLQLQYRPPNTQKVFISHPQIKNQTPHSFQIVHFDEQNQGIKNEQKVIPVQIRTKSKPRNNRRNNQHRKPIVHQHLTEITQPNYLNNKPERVENHRENNEEINDSSEQHETVVSEHEIPHEVPTKPNYPGEGQWAKYGVKHRPYINNQKQHSSVEEDDEKRPEGYDTFERGQEQFNRAQNKFRHDTDTFSERHQLNPSKNNFDDDSDSEPLYKKPEIGFVPQKLYAQVRRTENVEHLPRSAVDPEEEENAARLREVIKDSKIHTVYTEEGYEDSAYDHAGHEKKAENQEGHSQIKNKEAKSRRGRKGGQRSHYNDEGGRRRGKSSVRQKLRHDDTEKNENYDESEEYNNNERYNKNRDSLDAETAGSDYESKKIIPLPSKNITKVTLKNGDKEEINMEIHTEIKYEPGSQKKKHKYVKIIPSIKRNNNENFTIEEKNVNSTKILKRVKRYDKNQLSKKYVRKRPHYYWKKNKTTTTERTIVNMRKKFEAAFKTNKPSAKIYQNINSDIQYEESEEDIEISTTVKSTTSSTTTEVPISSTTVTTSTTTSTTTTIPSTTISTTTIITPVKEDDKTQMSTKKPEVTTKINKPSNPKVLPVKIKKFVRRSKRQAIDVPEIKVELDEFVDVTKLPKPTSKPDLTHLKYPYYTLPVTEKLHKNSPLRYVENVKNIPRKVENEMSFYDSRDHIICPEIESDVDPIPDRVKNQEEGEETDEMADTPDLPRLKGLGDKIDCLKVKYFGENPLDSPFFKEEIIQDPIPFFVTKKFKNSEKNLKKSKEKKLENYGQSKKRELKIKILDPIVVIDDELFETATINPIHENKKAVLRPPYTLEEMMTMSEQKEVKMPPKSIYDQINLLEDDEDKKIINMINDLPPADKFIIIYENQDIKSDSMKKEHPIENIIKMVKPAVNGYKTPKVSDIMTNLTKLSQNIPKPDIINIIPVNITADEILKPKSRSRLRTTPMPKSQVKRKKPIKTIRKLSVKTIKKPQTKEAKTSTITPILVSSTITTTKIPITTSQLPKIIQTTSTPTSTTTKKTLQAFKIPVPSPTSPLAPPRLNYHNNKPQNYRQFNPFSYVFDISRYLPRIPLPNHRYIASEAQYKEEIKPSQQMNMYSDVLKTINEAKEETKEQPVLIVSTVPSLLNINTSNITEKSDNVQQSSEQHIGLVPPSKNIAYRSVYEYYNKYEINSDYPDYIAQDSTKVNQYYATNLNGPTQNMHSISKRDTSKTLSSKHSKTKNEDADDLMMEESHIIENYVEHNKNKRSKRDTKRPQYTEIRRARPPKPQNEDVEEDEEDLNPRKRIYELKPNRPTTTTEKYIGFNFDEIIEEEFSVPDKPTTTAKPVYYPVQANKANPSVAEYIDFISKLHEKWEREMPSTTTTEKPSETTPQMVLTQSVAESVNVRRGEPSYLQIINHLHELRKEEETKNSPSTTTEEVEIIEQPSKPVKNSNPFIGDSLTADSFSPELNSMPSSESDSDSLLRTRNYSTKFKTSIDTSKYKTIERSPVSFRHNFSSRFNAEEEDLPLTRVQTTQKPMIIAIITKAQDAIPSTSSQNPQNSEPTAIPDSTIEETSNKVESATTSTTIKSTTVPTLSRSRQRSRSRSRPTTVATTTSRPVTSSTTSPIFRRRRPTRLTTTSTTQAPTIKPELFNRRRRLRPSETSSAASVPQNHKAAYTSVISSTRNPQTTSEPVIIVTPSTSTSEDTTKKQRRFQKVQERHVMSEVTLTRFYGPGSEETDDSSSSEESRKQEYEVIGPVKHVVSGHGGNFKHEKDKNNDENAENSDVDIRKHQYEVIGPLKHVVSGHGGNYKHEKDKNKSSNSNEDFSTIIPSDTYFTDPNLAVNVNQLKDEQSGISTEKNQASNSLLTKEELAEKAGKKPGQSKINLYPNMARMVNRLAETTIEPVTTVHQDVISSGEEQEETVKSEYKPTFIKDPSRRMYFYAKL